VRRRLFRVASGECSVSCASAFEAVACRSHAAVARTLEERAASVGVGRYAIALLEHHAKIGAGLPRFQGARAF